MPRPETKIENYLVQRVEAAGGLIRKLSYIGRRGAPDRIVVWGVHRGERSGFPCEVHFIELKAPGKKPDPHQEREHQRLRDLGAHIFVIDSKTAVDAYIMARI